MVTFLERATIGDEETSAMDSEELLLLKELVGSEGVDSSVDDDSTTTDSNRRSNAENSLRNTGRSSINPSKGS